MRRVLDLYDHPPGDGRVICVDEFGPLNLLPRKGKAWRPCRTPRRLRTTYTRTDGVMHMLAALDLASASCSTGPGRASAAAEAAIYGRPPTQRDYARGVEHALMWAQYATAAPPVPLKTPMIDENA